jgi:hypothetical protein
MSRTSITLQNKKNGVATNDGTPAGREEAKINQVKANANQANTDAALKVMQEKADASHKELLARLEDGRQANMKAW